MTENDINEVCKIYVDSLSLLEIALDIIKRLILYKLYTKEKIDKQQLLLADKMIDSLQPELCIIGKRKFLPTEKDKQNETPYKLEIYLFGDNGPVLKSKFMKSKTLIAIRNLIVNKSFLVSKRSNDGCNMYYSNFIFNEYFKKHFNNIYLKVLFYILLNEIIHK